MKRLPDAIFVIDTAREKVAVRKYRLVFRLSLIVDTNCDPDGVDHVEQPATCSSRGQAFAARFPCNLEASSLPSRKRAKIRGRRRARNDGRFTGADPAPKTTVGGVARRTRPAG
jgi:hypothetical protein